MIKRSIPLLAFLFFANLAFSQMPERVYRKKADTDSAKSSSIVCVGNQDAGEVQAGAFGAGGMSNDIDFPQVFLCLGDSINIDHINGTADLSGDPDPGTTAGIGYALYQCPPTITGEELDDILTDPCLQQPVPTTEPELHITFGDIGGNATFVNNGDPQGGFGGGAPIEIFFAPITIDNFGTKNYEFDGPCVNVRIDQTFSVVFLNEITITDQILSETNGSFTVQGGLPEFDNSDYTSIVIENVAIPGMLGTITSSNLSHDDMIQFTVPQAGTYNITITDGKSCNGTAQVIDMPCSGVEIIFNPIQIAPNKVGCVSVTTNNFDQILGLGFTMAYDPAILRYSSITNLNPALLTLNQAAFSAFPSLPEGLINLSWFQGPFSLPDGATIFEICFEAIGNVGDFSSISITRSTGFNPPFVETEIIDANAMLVPICIDPANIQIANLTLNAMTMGAECFQSADGEIDFTITGGNAPYTYTYQNLANAADMGSGAIATDGGVDNISGLTGGQMYQVVVTDSSNPVETIMQSFTITQPSQIGGNNTVLRPICAGDSTGNIVLNVDYNSLNIVFPDPDFSIEWFVEQTPGVQTPIPAGTFGNTINELNNIPAGTYTAVVTHLPTGCESAPTTSTITNPAPINAGLTSQIAKCAGFLDGSVTATPTGGVPSYTYMWDGPPNPNLPATTATVTGLDPGMYYVTITDSGPNNGCSHIDSIAVGATTILQVNDVTTDVTCFGADDGSITLTPSAIGVDNGGYNFDWNDLPGTMNPDIRMNLDGNNGALYEVTITDSGDCQIVDTFRVNEPAQIMITLDDLMNETCVTRNDGSATISVLGGVAPLSYDWGTTPNQTTLTATGLAGNNYTVTVTDGNMCMDSLLIQILPPDAPIISLPDTSLLTCSNSLDGSLEVVTIASASPVSSYQWSPNTTDNTAIVNNLGIGTYFVTVTTEDGCIAIDTAVITSPNPIILSDSIVRIPTCPEFSDGNVSIIVAGGSPPYFYEWSTGVPITSDAVLPGLIGDSTYCATITDSNQCEALEVCVYLPIPPPIVATYTNQTLVSCNDANTCDATATVLVSGGTGGNDYDFAWLNNETDSVPIALCAGWNVVEIKDGVCGITDSVFINAPDSLTATSIVIDEPTCFGVADGGASVMGAGGTPPYTFAWDTGSMTNSIFDVPSGPYNVDISDRNGCLFPLEIFIEEPDPLVASIDPLGTNDALCFGDLNGGDISVVWSGGNSGLATYEWTNNVSNTATASGLQIGNYIITVTDSEGCSDTTAHMINQPPPIVAVIPTPIEPQCFGFQTFITLDTVFGGNPGLFTYSVNNGPQQLVNAAIPVFADITHTISIFDSEGCRLDTMLFINQPNEVIVNLGMDEEIELGDSIQLEPQIISTLDIDTFFWTPTSFLSCTNCEDPWSSPLSTQAYNFTAQDINGCVGSDDIIIDVDKNRNVYIPNIFSPNGDGFNDEFRIESGAGVVDINFMYIFDRWGEQVFGAENFVPTDPRGIWFGDFRGKLAPTGVYVYIIEVDFADGITLLYRGDVAIIR